MKYGDLTGQMAGLPSPPNIQESLNKHIMNNAAVIRQCSIFLKNSDIIFFQQQKDEVLHHIKVFPLPVAPLTKMVL
jgi:hypothetical protein